jgi:SAM-dependent methyltransferase
MVARFLKALRDTAARTYTADILHLAGRYPHARFLDPGCDDGHWTTAVGRSVGTDDLYGMEIVAERACKAHDNRIRVTRADLEHGLPFAAGTFDIVHANQLIEHIARTEFLVREIHRVLKPGGYAVICTENLASWHNIVSLLLGYMPMSSSNFSSIHYNVGNPLALHTGKPACLPESWQHVRVLTLRGLVDIFRLHGFTVTGFRGAGYYPFPARIGRLDPTHAAFVTVRFTKTS